MIDQEIAAQLDGIARVLGETVAGYVSDPYAADVLAGAITTLGLLAAASAELDGFIAWDTAATIEALTVLGVDPPPTDPTASAGARLDSLRAALESAIGTVVLEEAELEQVTAKLAAILQDRAARYPLAARPARANPKGTHAHPSR